MTPHYESAEVTLWHGDCLAVLRTLPDASVDAVVTDPPYGLEFMGKEWDSFKPSGARIRERDGDGWPGSTSWKISRPDSYSAGAPFQQWCFEWATECLRVLKPGGHMLAFGGTRTWHRLACAIEDAGFEIRDSIAWMYGSGFPKSLDVSKAIDKAAGAEREVVGIDPRYVGMSDKAKRALGALGHEASPTGFSGDPSIVTAPATAAARTWQGWGTALKPSHEPVLVACKPLSLSLILARIGSQLDALEDTWQALEVAPTTRTGEAADSPARTDTSPSGSAERINSNTASSWRACWAELCDLTSTSTTETTSRMTTDLRTLSSSLSRLMAESTPPSGTSQPGWTSTATAVDNLLASVVCGLRATLALSVVDPATSSTPPTSLGAAGSGPAFEPVVVARKPLTGTVAGNVLEHGTGALNVDATRIGTDEDTSRKPAAVGDTSAPFGRGVEMGGNGHASGRWPANVILDEDQAAVLDEQSGESLSRIGKPRAADSGDGWGMTATGAEYDDLGGASRFFYVAKADASERPKVDGVMHPTVKPLALMRWLVRLVTPPGGTVLEPFAGSGTTVEACLLEGFRCIAIEKGAEYLPLIEARIHRRRDPVAAHRLSGDDEDNLFDLLETT